MGVTNPLKVLLEKDGIRAHAVYRVVDEIHEETRLSDGRLRQRLRDYLSSYEIDALLERRDALVDHIRILIDDRGSGAVLY